MIKVRNNFYSYVHENDGYILTWHYGRVEKKNRPTSPIRVVFTHRPSSTRAPAIFSLQHDDVTSYNVTARREHDSTRRSRRFFTCPPTLVARHEKTERFRRLKHGADRTSPWPERFAGASACRRLAWTIGRAAVQFARRR